MSVGRVARDDMAIGDTPVDKGDSRMLLLGAALFAVTV
jgi:hypothetical protein